MHLVWLGDSLGTLHPLATWQTWAIFVGAGYGCWRALVDVTRLAAHLIDRAGYLPRLQRKPGARRPE